MVAKHRRSEIEPSLMSRGAPVETADIWPEAVGYGQTSYPEPSAYGTNDYGRPWGGGNGYGDAFGGNDAGGAALQPGRAAAPDDDVWQEWHDWRNWGPPPAMHPDHPSAPVPRVQLPEDHPSGSMAVRAPGPDVLPQRRRDGFGRGAAARRCDQMPVTTAAADGFTPSLTADPLTTR